MRLRLLLSGLQWHIVVNAQATLMHQGLSAGQARQFRLIRVNLKEVLRRFSLIELLLLVLEWYLGTGLLRAPNRFKVMVTLL